MKRQFTIGLCAAVVMLGGCADVQSLTRLDPVYYGNTQKSPEAYVECVSNSWRGMGEKVHTELIPNGADLVVQGSFNVEIVLRAQLWHDHTDVKMYTRLPYGYRDMEQSANLCM